MWLVGCIFVAGTSIATTCEVDIAVAYVLAHIYKIVSSTCPYSIMAVCLIFAVWQAYLFIDISCVYSDTGVDIWYTYTHTQGCICTLIHTHIDSCLFGYTCTYMYIFMYECLHTYMSTYIHPDLCTHMYTHLDASVHVCMCTTYV